MIKLNVLIKGKLSFSYKYQNSRGVPVLSLCILMGELLFDILLITRTEVSERNSSGGSTLLPSNTKEKDSQSKEELHKLMNGNGAGIDAATDRVCLLKCFCRFITNVLTVLLTYILTFSIQRQRMPANGKIIDDGNPTLNEIVLNGS